MSEVSTNPNRKPSSPAKVTRVVARALEIQRLDAELARKPTWAEECEENFEATRTQLVEELRKLEHEVEQDSMPRSHRSRARGKRGGGKKKEDESK